LSFGPVGIKDATQDEFDLILEIRNLRSFLQSTVKAEWTPGHPTPTDPRGEQVRNAFAHSLAVQRLRQPESTDLDDDFLTLSGITVLHKGVILTRGLPQQLSADIHYNDLKTKLLKDNLWSEATFLSVDWDSYHKAILSLPRNSRLSIAKLSHNLWNTNEQNSKYYNQENKCPYCTAKESQDHVFCCPSTAATANRTEALQTLHKTLKKYDTPPALVSLLSNMLLRVDISSYDPDLCPLVAQQRSIGWAGLNRGHLSMHWRSSFTASLPADSKRRTERAQTWCKKVIMALWEYSRTLWEARNAVVHGKTTLQEDSKAIVTLRQAVKKQYQLYAKDPHIIPASRAHLFDKPLLILLQSPKPQLQC
jgi:hypothetical protein